MSTFWRTAGMTYLEYVNASSNALRNALKEPLKSKAAARSRIHLRERWWENGAPGAKSEFFSSFSSVFSSCCRGQR
jgi:F-type H+-transporting ATPase subunit epsilon